MGDGMLAIGTFSRASFLSIKALRAYHESGLLVPARVDPHTGYRSYHPSQLIDAAVILRLRSLDVPLDQVREVVHARDPDVTARVLAAHAETMASRLADVQRIVAQLHEGLATPAEHTPVHTRAEPHQHTLAVRGQVTEADFDAFLGDAYARLGTWVDRLGVAPIGPPAALYPAERVDDGPEDVEAYLPLGGPVAVPARSGLVLGEVPASDVAVLVHLGGYDAISETYRKLGAWVAEHARPRQLPVRESYTVSFAETTDTERFRTEIQWPIHRPVSTEEHP